MSALDKCLETKEFCVTNIDNVMLDYGRNYLLQPTSISMEYRGWAFQGLGYGKFVTSTTTVDDSFEPILVHKNNILYVPSHDNFYHMMIDYIPRIHAARGDDRPVAICKGFVDKLPNVFSAVQNWFPNVEWEFLELHPHPKLGLKNRCLLPGRLVGNNIGFFGSKSLNPLKARHNNKVFGVYFWQQWYKEHFETQVQERKIFLYRTAGRTRLANQDEIFNELEKRGFEKIDPANHSLEEIAVIMNGASTIIGAHGAGLTNAIFCQPNTKYIEFGNNSTSDVFYKFLASVGNADYHILYGTDPLTNLPMYNNDGGYTIDIQSVLSLI